MGERGDSRRGRAAADRSRVASPQDNGPSWVVFLVTFIFLFATAVAFLVHSLMVTFG